MLSLEQQKGDNLIPYFAKMCDGDVFNKFINFQLFEMSSLQSLAKRLVYKLVHWHRFSKYKSERERGKWTDGQNLSLMADVCDCRVRLKRAARFSHGVFSNHLSSLDEVEVHSGHWWKSRSTPVHHSPDWLAGCIIYACIWCYSETQSGYVATLCTRCRLRFASICLSKWYPERPHSIDFKCS